MVSARRGSAKKRKAPARPWPPFVHADALPSGNPLTPGAALWVNSRYTVIARPVDGWDGWLWLSIRRNDRRAVHDWRHLQRIKSEIAGPEREAVELYPAESRLVDTSNQYHLWVAPGGVRFPFGYTERLLVDTEEAHAARARQRRLPPDWTGTSEKESS